MARPASRQRVRLLLTMWAFSGRESDDSSRQPRVDAMRARDSRAVIAFPQDRVRPASRRRGEGACEVVIFSGVRIERMEEPREVTASSSGLLSPRPRRGRGQG